MEAVCRKCKHEWNYKGKKTELLDRKIVNSIYVQCPVCYSKITLRREQ